MSTRSVTFELVVGWSMKAGVCAKAEDSEYIRLHESCLGEIRERLNPWGAG